MADLVQCPYCPPAELVHPALLTDHIARLHHPGLAYPPPATVDDAVSTAFIPPIHYVRDDGAECCVHAIPVGPDSCLHCRELADG